MSHPWQSDGMSEDLPSPKNPRGYDGYDMDISVSSRKPMYPARADVSVFEEVDGVGGGRKWECDHTLIPTVSPIIL